MLDLLIIPQLIFFVTYFTCLLDATLIMKGEILSWSLLGVKGLSCQHMSIFSALCDLKQELIGLPFSIQLTLPLR